MTELLSFVELFGVGIGVGLVGALLGIGGGLIMVPLFMLTMMTPNGTTFQTVQQVIGTSLFGVFLNSASGTIAYIRQKRVMFRAALPFAAATIPGAFLGSYVTEYFSGPGFSITFGVSLAALGIFMFLKSRSRRATARVEDFDVAHAEFSYTIGITLSFFVGFISSIFGYRRGRRALTDDGLYPRIPGADCRGNLHLCADGEFRDRCCQPCNARAHCLDRSRCGGVRRFCRRQDCKENPPVLDCDPSVGHYGSFRM